MKRLYCIAFFSLLIQVSQAQTFAEWFRQKKTQVKYLAEQISALTVYAGYLQKGYAIAQQGISTINDIKHGDFLLHEGHFNAMKTVSPVITATYYVVAAKVLAIKIDLAANKGSRQVVQNACFADDEKQYLQLVYKNLLDATAADVAALTNFTTDDEISLTDDERIGHVTAAYTALQEKYAFVQSFSKQAQMLAVQRIKQQGETNSLKKLYNIK